MGVEKMRKRYKQTKDNLDFAMYIAFAALVLSIGVPVVIMWAGAQ